MRSYITVTINDKPMSDEVLATVLSVSIRDAAGESSDSCEIVFDDADDQIVLPTRGEPVQVTLYRDDAPDAAGFEGVIDDVRWRIARGDGQVLVVECKAADMRGDLKTRKEKHKDDATLEEAAKGFAPEGYTVKFGGDLGAIKRDYWYLGRENFLHWAQRTAREIGATFKVMGKTAVFTPRNAGQTASGQALPTITVAKGVNLINADISPDLGRPQRKSFDVTWYDPKEAKWKNRRGKVEGVGVLEESGTHRFSAPDQDTAERQAQAMEKEATREKGGGSVTITGDPAAQAEALCVLVARPGVSGTYQIDSAEQRWTRAEGWTTTLDLKRPGANGSDEPGTDKRGKKKSRTDDSSLGGVLDE
jgi:phage protein D